MTFLPGENPKAKAIRTILQQVRDLLACPKLDRGSLMLTGTNPDHRTLNQLIIWGSNFAPAPKQLLRNFLEAYAAELEATLYLMSQDGQAPKTKREEDIKRISDNLRFLGPRMIMEQIYRNKPGKFEHFRNFYDMEIDLTREQLIEIAYDENITLTY